MAHLSNLLKKAAVLTPKRNGYDLSHENLFTAMCGTLTPCFVEEVIGNTNISVTPSISVSLPPLATDFYGRVDAVVEMFFVPLRQCYGGYEEWYSQTRGIGLNMPNESKTYGGDSFKVNSAAMPNAMPPVFERLPYHTVSDAVLNTVGRSGSLLDYIGVKTVGSWQQTPVSTLYNWNPLIAYHRIWETFYRRPSLEAPAFVAPTTDSYGTQSKAKYVQSWPYMKWSSDCHEIISDASSQFLRLNDGKSIFDLRQRHYDYDYFTSALPSPNASADNKSAFVVAQGNSTDTNTQFSIQSLRAANSLAQFLDRQAVTGWRYRDNALARTGCLPPELSRDPLYLGRMVCPVYNNSIKTSAPSVNYDGETAVNTSAQPWSGTGSRVASPTASGSNTIVKNFHAKEAGIIMGIFSLVPHAYYSTGIRRYLTRSVVTDYPDALLQNAGMQTIKQSELVPNVRANNAFGWTIPYACSLYHDDEVHGLFNDNGSLSAFALKRGFAVDSNPIINSAFCTIPKTALDEVCAADAAISDYGCMVDAYFTEKIVTPLAGYVVPTLGTPDFMKTQLVNRGGSDLC